MNQPLHTLDDRALWERSCRGDDAAWQALRERFGPGMTAILLLRTEPGAVRGVLEEVFGRARGDLPRIPDPSAVGRWLLEQARTHPVGGRGAAGGDLGRMLTHVGKLDDAVAEAVLLQAVAGLDANGIADLLDVRKAEVEARLAQGRDRLQRVVDPAALARALEPYRYRAARPKKNPIPLVVVLLLLGLAVGGYLLLQKIPKATSGWLVAWTSGAQGTNDLAVGGRIDTGADQRARIALGEDGHVDVEPTSLVRREPPDGDVPRLALEQGALGVEVTGPRLLVTTKRAEVRVAVGGVPTRYVVEADAEGSGLVRVLAGGVEIRGANAPATFVPDGAACRLHPEGGAGVPAFEDGPAELRDVTPDGAVAAALVASTPRDTLVLWSLLPRIETADRELVVARLVELVPPPPGVESEAVVAQEPAALAAWEAVLRTHW